MAEQLSLFAAPATTGDDCKHPEHTAASAYRMGCRCPRCRADHKRGIGPLCQADGCTARRQRHRRYCTDHGTRPLPGRVAQSADCAACARPFTFYESQVAQAHRTAHGRAMRRLICGPCIAGHGGVIVSHNLDVSWSVRLIRATDCELCHNRFTVGKRGRYASHVDHDHAHCSPLRHGSCGRCVRGIICARCNMIVGAIEAADRDIGIDKVRAYLDAYAFR